MTKIRGILYLEGRMTNAWRELILDLTHASVPVKSKGSGPNALICLHGYMQNKDLFDVLFPEIPSGWRVICMDLPLFGKSEWKGEKGIDGTFFKELWEALNREFSIDNWHIMGFSMGGKIAMLMYQFAPIEIQKAMLIAPDGIKMNYWHELVVKSKIGDRLFRWALANPKILLKVGGFLYSMKLLSGFSIRFLRISFANPQNRELLQKTIQVYHSFPFKFKDWANQQATKSTKWHLVWGKKDRVLKPSVSERFVKKIPNTEVHLINGGHMLVTNNPRRLRKLIDRDLFGLPVRKKR